MMVDVRVSYWVWGATLILGFSYLLLAIYFGQGISLIAGTF